MGFVHLHWAFVLVVTLHNLEEAVWLPEWSRQAGRWHHPVRPAPFRFAAVVLTILAGVLAAISIRGGTGSPGRYLFVAYAIAMLLNVALPHLVATVVLRRYCPGLATGLLGNLPVTAAIVFVALRDGHVAPWPLAGVAVLFVVGILALIPLLFRVGEWLFP